MFYFWVCLVASSYIFLTSCLIFGLLILIFFWPVCLIYPRSYYNGSLKSLATSKSERRDACLVCPGFTCRFLMLLHFSCRILKNRFNWSMRLFYSKKSLIGSNIRKQNGFRRVTVTHDSSISRRLFDLINPRFVVSRIQLVLGSPTRIYFQSLIRDFFIDLYSCDCNLIPTPILIGFPSVSPLDTRILNDPI